MTKPDISELKLSAKSQETGLDVHESTIAELKQLQEALKVSEDNYFSLIEHNADGIVVLNSHTIEFVNHKF